jgi:hypothetical protein
VEVMTRREWKMSVVLENASSDLRLSTSKIETYQKKGYIILKDFITHEISKDLLYALIKILKKYNPLFPGDLLKCSSWDDPKLTDELISFRSKEPQLFGIFYDALQNSTILQALFTQYDLINVVGQLLDDDEKTISSTGHMLRIDVPKDTRNILAWHQDSAYYIQNQASENGCVVLLPLVDLFPENGTLKLLEGSQNESTLEHKLGSSNSEHTSEKFEVPESIVNKYSEIDLYANKGDLVIFQMNLIHKSGFNSSHGVRYTAGARFHKTLADDFLPGRLIYVPNNTLENKLRYNG